MLQTVWNELYYRVDVCRITKGAHIEHLKVCNKNLECCSIKYKKYTYCYLKCIVHDRLLKPQQSFRITLYLCVLCGSQNQQRLFPYTELDGWVL
jgi:hypothetical protein